MWIAPLNKKLYRDLWHLKTQVLAISAVIASGVALYVTMLGTMASLDETMTAYYERYRFADVFAGVKRAPRTLRDRIAMIEGVATVEDRISVTVTIDVPAVRDPVLGQVLSLPMTGNPLLNGVLIREGRAPNPLDPSEVLVSEAFANAHELTLGSSLSAVLNGRKKPLKIVGFAMSPEYIYAISPGSFIPDNERFGILWMPRDGLEAAFDLEDAFNSVTLTLLRSASETEVIRQLDVLTEPYGGLGAYGREDQISHFFVSGEMDQLRAFGNIMPPLFLAVAAFLLNMVISRLIATEREQIGLLKAFGYSNVAVAVHYFKLVMFITIIGIAIGLFGGAWLGRGMTNLYGDFFSFPFLLYRLDTATFIMASFISILAALFGTSHALWGVMKLNPAIAMAPATPTVYRRSILEIIGFLKRLDQPTRMIFRHLFRWPVRTILSISGVAMSLAILISATFMLDSMEYLIDFQYNIAGRQDASVNFFEARPREVTEELRHLPGVLSVETFRAVPVRLRAASRSYRTSIMGMETDAQLNRLILVDETPLSPPKHGLTLTEKLASILNVDIGDPIQIEVMTGRRKKTSLPVVEIVASYIGLGAYAHIDTVNQMMQEGKAVTGAFLLTDENYQDELYTKLKDRPAIGGIALQTASLESFRETMAESTSMSTYVSIFFASLIAMGVVYNNARITLSERARELASLRVLGFSLAEVSYILLGELGFLTMVAMPIGVLLGYLMGWSMVAAFDTELYRLPFVLTMETVAFSCVAIMMATVLSSLFVFWRVRQFDLISVLKTRE